MEVTGAPRLTRRASKLAPTARCCLAIARKLGEDMSFLLRIKLKLGVELT
jgi:hypothetical protein